MLKYFCKQRGCSFEQDKDIPPPDHCPICNNPANFEVEEISKDKSVEENRNESQENNESD